MRQNTFLLNFLPEIKHSIDVVAPPSGQSYAQRKVGQNIPFRPLSNDCIFCQQAVFLAHFSIQNKRKESVRW